MSFCPPPVRRGVRGANHSAAASEPAMTSAAATYSGEVPTLSSPAKASDEVIFSKSRLNE